MLMIMRGAERKAEAVPLEPPKDGTPGRGHGKAMVLADIKGWQ